MLFPSSKPRIGVVGANGRLGQAIVSHFESLAETVPITRKELDLGEKNGIRTFIRDSSLDMVVITAAMTAVDECESRTDLAYAINAEGPGEIARVCAETGIKVVYFSTDFVFDGDKEGSYTEDDETNPISKYGASKLKGEEEVLMASRENLVVRVSWLYGAASPAFPEWIIGQATTKDRLELPGEKLGSPTSSEDVAMYLETLLKCDEGKSASGVVHLCNSGSCSWQEWGQFCVDAAVEAGLPVKAKEVGSNRMEDIAAFVAKRPVNSVLNNTKFAAVTGVEPRSWQEALGEHLACSPLLREHGASKASH